MVHAGDYPDPDHHHHQQQHLPVHAGDDPEEVSLAAELFPEGGEGEQRSDLAAQEGEEGQEEGPGVAVSHTAALLRLSIKKFSIRSNL